MTKKDYPEEPTSQAKIDSTRYNAKLLGKNKYGTVHLHGPYGNKNTKTIIAYNIGMHPLESKAHRALFETINNKTSKLNHQYYIYNINVNKIDEKTEGRMDGQLLAQEYVAPHIINNKYTFFCDIHSNKGLVGPGKYEKTNFIFSPGFDEKSTKIQNQILKQIPQLEYYAPEYRTSPEYITIPVVKTGIPTIVYETFSYEKMEKTYELIEKLVDIIDKIKFEEEAKT